MDESQEPRRPSPKPPAGAGKPLPRLWKHEPDEDELRAQKEEEDKRKKAKAEAETPPPAAPVRKERPRKKKAEEDPKKPGNKSVLIEETPDLDTYEARRRARILLGVSFCCMALMVGIFLYRTFAPESSGAAPTADIGPPVAVPGAVSRERIEQEASHLFERAREDARNGNTPLAVSRLKRITASYATTKAAAEAREALGRPAKNLPLFLDRPAVLASAEPAKAAPPKKEEPKVVEATPTAVASAKGAEANLVLPVNPAEPLPPTALAVPPSIVPGASPGPAARPLPKGFYAPPGTRVHASGWPVAIAGERDGAQMVLVPGGSFSQGRDGGDPAEGPAHKVHVATFYVDQHEVTVGQFKLFQKESGRRTERDRFLTREPTSAALDADDTRPVVLVTARDATDYAAWAGKRLPTEAQWEVAARGADGRIFPWGNTPGTPRTDRKTRPVMAASGDLSPCGAFDMAGNAQEWTNDWYDSKYYQLFRTTPAENPVGPATRPRTQQLVVKGGSAEGILTHREGQRFDVRLPYLGFRCVLQVEGPANAFQPPPPPAPPAAPGGKQKAGGGTVVPF
jgi:sulfatase modifying factor 1